MVASLQFGTVAGYYVQQHFHGGECQLARSWYSPGNSFGLTHGENIDPEKFQRLHAGIGDDGRVLLTTRGRDVNALDLTFSATKSVSLAYACSTDARSRRAILDAHLKAVHAALAVLDQEAIYARRGRNGLVRQKVDLTAAVFTHDSARPEVHCDGALFADPQLHSHAVLLSLAERKDGTVGAIDTRLGKFKLLAGGIYHAHLAFNLLKLGYTVFEIGENGVFEIGFDQIVRKYFSARRKHIVDKLAEAGVASAEAPGFAAAMALSTRRPKLVDNDVDRFACWQEKAKSLGIDPERVVEDLQRQGESELPGEDELSRRLSAIPRELTESETDFARRDLLRAVAVAHVGTTTDPNAIVAEAERLLESGDIIEIQRRGHEAILSTPEVIRLAP